MSRFKKLAITVVLAGIVYTVRTEVLYTATLISYDPGGFMQPEMADGTVLLEVPVKLNATLLGTIYLVELFGANGHISGDESHGRR